MRFIDDNEDLPPFPVSPRLHRSETLQGSDDRYQARVKRFEADGLPRPRLRHAALWLLHNAIAHPLLGFFPGKKTVEAHELTSSWLNHDDFSYQSANRIRRVTMPTIPSRRAWLLHNVVSHVAIGVLPCRVTFALHDRTAKAMNVPGWV